MEKKSNEIPLVVTSETGKAQTVNTVQVAFGITGYRETLGEANKPNINQNC